MDNIKGILIGHDWYGNRVFYPVDADVEKLPETIGDLDQFDDFGLKDITGGFFVVYPYATIGRIWYLAQQYTSTFTVGEVTEEDKKAVFTRPEIWI